MISINLVPPARPFSTARKVTGRVTEFIFHELERSVDFTVKEPNAVRKTMPQNAVLKSLEVQLVTLHKRVSRRRLPLNRRSVAPEARRESRRPVSYVLRRRGRSAVRHD